MDYVHISEGLAVHAVEHQPTVQKMRKTPGEIPKLIFGVGANKSCIEKPREKRLFVPAKRTGWTVPGSGNACMEIQ